MALWITGGHTVEREIDGVTLIIPVMAASDMIDYMEEAQRIPTEGREAVDAHIELCFKGCVDWNGDGVPEWSREALATAPLPALVRIIKAVVEVNTVGDEDKGN
jgi:hypothetical protein